MERVDVVGVCGGEVLRGLRGEDLLRRLLRLRRGEGGREVGVLEVPGPDAVTAPGEPRRRDAVAAQSLLQFGDKCLLVALVPSWQLSRCTRFIPTWNC